MGWENSGFIEGVTTGPHHVQLTGGSLLSVPRPITAQMERRAALHLADKPPGACRCPDQTARVGTDEALPLTAWILSQPVAGMRVADGHFHCPAVAIRVDEVVGASRQSGGDKGVDGGERFALPGPVGGVFALTSQHHDPHEGPRPHRGPQAILGLDLRARFAGVGCPSLGGLGQGLWRADQVAFFARGATSLGYRLGRQRIELGADRQTPDHMGRLRPPPARVLGGRAPLSQHSHEAKR